MTPFDEMATKIVKEQELIIGPIAWQEAEKVAGLHVTSTHEGISIEASDGGQVIDKLVNQYERLFGRASREVCRDAVAGILSTLQPSQIPSSLLP